MTMSEKHVVVAGIIKINTTNSETVLMIRPDGGVALLMVQTVTVPEDVLEYNGKWTSADVRILC